MGMFDKVKESLTKKEYTCDQCGATVLRAPLLADHQKEVLCPACTQKRNEERERIDEETKGIQAYMLDYHLEVGYVSDAKKKQALEKREADLAKYSVQDNPRREDIQKIGERYRELTPKNLAMFYFTRGLLSFDDRATNFMLSTHFLALRGYPGVIADVDDVFAIVSYTPGDLKLKDGIEAVNYIFFTNNPYVPVCHRTDFFAKEGSSSIKEQRESLENKFLHTCKKLTYPLMTTKEFEKLVKKEGEVRGDLKKRFVLDQLTWAYIDEYQYKSDKMVYDSTEETIDFMEEHGFFTKNRLNKLLGMDDPEVGEYWEKTMKEGMLEVREEEKRKKQGGEA